MDNTDWKAKYEKQLAVTNSLKRDLAALQAKTKIPCPTHGALGLGCDDHYKCWEPCGAMGNDERFVSKADSDVADQVNVALGLPITRQPK